MFNRLNRNVSMAMCLGGAMLLAIGCADSDEPSVTATAAASKTTQDAAETPKAEANQDEKPEAAPSLAVRNRTDSGEGDGEGIGLAQRERPNPALLTADGSRLLPPDTQDAPALAQPTAGEQLIFSPAQSHRSLGSLDGAGDRVASSEIRVELDPELLDLGTMGTSETKTGIIALRNTSDQPVMIENSRTSCGCTVANVPRGEYIQPGDSVEVEVQLRSSIRSQVLNKTVTFMIRDHPPLTARVRADVISYVEVEPATLSPEATPDGRLTLKSHDGEPFKITSMHPQITVDPPSDEASAIHEMTISWDQWRELGEARRVLFYIDHPKASQVTATIRVPRQQQIDRRREAAAVNGAAPSRIPAVVSQLQRGNTDEVIKAIAEGEADVNVRDRSGQTLLAVAARHGHLDVVNALIEAGADVNATDNVGRTPLMTAGQSRNTEIVKRLIEAGAELETADNTVGATALAWAAGFGDAESVKALLDAGANFNVTTGATGFTPLIWAAGFGQTDSVKAIIERGGNIEAADFAEGATALMHATRTGQTDNVKALIAAGANIEATDNAGKTPLLWAAGASGADIETIKALVEAGAKLDVRDRAGLGALDHARGRTDANAEDVVAYLASLIGEDADN